MMTYRNSHNDPTAHWATRSPEEVKSMLGCGDYAEEEAEQYAKDRWNPRESSVDLHEFRMRAIFSSPTAGRPSSAEYERAKAQSAGRCPTCGRAFDCACGDECEVCVDGVPRRAEGEPERYAPASR